MPSPVRFYAPPKINLTLRILGQRPDGYHELQSLVAFAETGGDWITLTPVAAAHHVAPVHVTGPYAADITGPNILDQALQHLASTQPHLTLGTVTLEKNIPVASGIGGGSSDAAALLKAIAAINPELAGSIDWHAIAATLGADVTVCYLARAAYMTGRGEHVHPLTTFPTTHAVLVTPATASRPDKTAAVFAHLNAPPLKVAATTAPAPATTAPPPPATRSPPSSTPFGKTQTTFAGLQSTCFRKLPMH